MLEQFNNKVNELKRIFDVPQEKLNRDVLSIFLKENVHNFVYYYPERHPNCRGVGLIKTEYTPIEYFMLKFGEEDKLMLILGNHKFEANILSLECGGTYIDFYGELDEYDEENTLKSIRILTLTSEGFFLESEKLLSKELFILLKYTLNPTIRMIKEMNINEL